MVSRPNMPRPINQAAREGLILSWDDVEKTGTYRQGRPEYRLLRPIWIDVHYDPEADAAALANAAAVRHGHVELWQSDEGPMVRYKVSAGFVTDRYSLSRRLRFRQPAHPAWWAASAMHDCLLELGLVAIKRANEIFRLAMVAIGVSRVDRVFAFAGVEIARHVFPSRISRVDPDNVAFVERLTGQDVARRVTGRPRGLSASMLRAIRAAGAGYVRKRAGGVL